VAKDFDHQMSLMRTADFINRKSLDLVQ
jgi:hypothetical protein